MTISSLSIECLYILSSHLRSTLLKLWVVCMYLILPLWIFVLMCFVCRMSAAVSCQCQYWKNFQLLLRFLRKMPIFF